MLSKKDNKKEAKQTTYKKYSVDFSNPLENKLLTLESVLKFLQNNMKLNGLKGKLGKTILINTDEKREKSKTSIVISVDSSIKFSKRYIRYLVKKFLKKEGVAKYLTLTATSPSAYMVKVIKKNEA
jgi:large subunit ribosomal protein L22e